MSAKIGFEMKRIDLTLDSILLLRKSDDSTKLHSYQTILASIREVGMIEPLVVHKQQDKSDTFILLDGHLRLQALKELGKISAECIIATDDESFTYNARINRLPPVQCHKMIVKAVKNGVKPERIAAALNIPLQTVRGMITLLDGINAEAAEMLKDKNLSPRTIRLLKRVAPMRQIEMAELMIKSNNYSTTYAEIMIVGTPKDQLVNSAVKKERPGFSPDEVARMQREMESVEQDLKVIEATYTENMMNFTLARAYIKKLLENAKVVRFLNGNYSDILAQFESIASSETL
jgi:ParB-like chromosome segregation protein Spo0J